MKTLLFLGASWFQIPPIRRAKERGYRVLTCDNRPSNPGHALADRILDMSTVDREAVLLAVREEALDGVVCFASDVSAPTAAYLAEKLGLPGHPLHAVETLCDKELYRNHLEREGFPNPGFAVSRERETLRSSLGGLRPPWILKPVDVSGSKGITKLEEASAFDEAFERARHASRSGRVLLEEFFERRGHQLTGDGFLLDGELVFRCYANQHFSPRGDPCQPVGESVPAGFGEEVLLEVDAEVRRLMSGLGMRSGALNFDILLGEDGEILLCEIGPRAGGNAIPWLIEEATGADLVSAVLDAALGEPVDLESPAEVRPLGSLNLVDLLRAEGWREGGRPPGKLRLSPEFRSCMFYHRLRLKGGRDLELPPSSGESGPAFRPDDLKLGFFMLSFPGAEEGLELMEHMDRHISFR